MPRAMTNWMRPKVALLTMAWWPMARPAQVIWCASPAGLLTAMPTIICDPNALVNM